MEPSGNQVEEQRRRGRGSLCEPLPDGSIGAFFFGTSAATDGAAFDPSHRIVSKFIPRISPQTVEW